MLSVCLEQMVPGELHLRTSRDREYWRNSIPFSLVFHSLSLSVSLTLPVFFSGSLSTFLSMSISLWLSLPFSLSLSYCLPITVCLSLSLCLSASSSRSSSAVMLRNLRVFPAQMVLDIEICMIKGPKERVRLLTSPGHMSILSLTYRYCAVC